MNTSSFQGKPLSLGAGIVFAAMTTAAFHAAYAGGALAWLMIIYLAGLCQLARLGSVRLAFYLGLAVGFACVAPQVQFFWVVFGPAGIVLWFVVALWIGAFAGLACAARKRFGPLWSAALMPFLWTGLEYFRSELYYLRFSWLNPSYAFAGHIPVPWINLLGMYGFGFLLAGIAAATLLPRRKVSLVYVGAVMLLAAIPPLARIGAPSSPTVGTLRVAGVQMEFPKESDVLANLDRLVKAHPDVDLILLSEYTFDGPIPEEARDWCRKNRKYLAAGGKEPTPDKYFRNTVFVIDPQGEVAFKQAKSVPIQFFQDGHPALSQQLWESPWGRLGFCICYDFSYRRVVDQLVRLGAQAMIVPTMDVESWGKRQHDLHAMVAPIRAAEYGLPVFRVASSGISQITDARGGVIASAAYPGQNDLIYGTLELPAKGTLPLDTLLAPLATAIAGAVLLLCALPNRLWRRWTGERETNEGPSEAG